MTSSKSHTRLSTPKCQLSAPETLRADQGEEAGLQDENRPLPHELIGAVVHRWQSLSPKYGGLIEGSTNFEQDILKVSPKVDVHQPQDVPQHPFYAHAPTQPLPQYAHIRSSSYSHSSVSAFPWSPDSYGPPTPPSRSPPKAPSPYIAQSTTPPRNSFEDERSHCVSRNYRPQEDLTSADSTEIWKESTERVLHPSSHSLLRIQSPRTSSEIEMRGRGRDESMALPPQLNELGSGPKSGSLPRQSRSTPHPTDTSDGKLRKHRSWMPGSSSRSKSRNASHNRNSSPEAWVITGAPDDRQVAYNSSPLLQAEKIPELWDETGDLYVYLFPQSCGRGPSFRVASHVISASPHLMSLAYGRPENRRRGRSFEGRSSLSVEDASRINGPRSASASPPLAIDNKTASQSLGDPVRVYDEPTPKEGHLYFPVRIRNADETAEQSAQGDLEYLVSVRNLFAFLTGRSLVATKTYPSTFMAVYLLAGHLSRLGFSNADGTTFGEAAANNWRILIQWLDLADVRDNVDRIVDALILGERMRSATLYNEAFTHAVGKYEDIMHMRPGNFQSLSLTTRNRLERASIDLQQRQQNANLILSDFEFPALFSGMATSSTTAESRLVRFKAWKSHFLSMRRHVLSYYKDLYGSWPPKASSKKNNFVESGLNRLVMKELYRDLSMVYDLLVDRKSLTTRSMDADGSSDETDPIAAALRKLLSEADHSSPPVHPPMPFDIPSVPRMSLLSSNHSKLVDKARHREETRKLKESEITQLLARSHNADCTERGPFLEKFKAFEQREAKGKNVRELAEQRYGHWVFIYVVLQALPMLVVDAPDLQHTSGVEYFLCSPPRGGAPWVEDTTVVKRSWYGIAGGGGVVSLPSDVVDFGVEGIYRRSHCWTMGGKWLAELQPELPELASPVSPVDRPGFSLAPAAPSGPAVQDERTTCLRAPPRHGRARSADSRRPRPRASMAFGLEPLPVPQGFGIVSQDDGPNRLTGTDSELYSRHRNFSEEQVDRVPSTRPVYVRHSSGGSIAETGKGKSFDDILLDIGKGQAKVKERKSMWFG
ncbi:MAG: hypothetical protein M1818_004952 [Claussenomyces sp. TS43310]|nr:MAG: hypothetical protein M1818_004952 [Claussenomyces sp. TS43310]